MPWREGEKEEKEGDEEEKDIEEDDPSSRKKNGEMPWREEDWKAEKRMERTKTKTKPEEGGGGEGGGIETRKN